MCSCRRCVPLQRSLRRRRTTGCRLGLWSLLWLLLSRGGRLANAQYRLLYDPLACCHSCMLPFLYAAVLLWDVLLLFCR